MSCAQRWPNPFSFPHRSLRAVALYHKNRTDCIDIIHQINFSHCFTLEAGRIDPLANPRPLGEFCRSMSAPNPIQVSSHAIWTYYGFLSGISSLCDRIWCICLSVASLLPGASPHTTSPQPLPSFHRCSVVLWRQCRRPCRPVSGVCVDALFASRRFARGFSLEPSAQLSRRGGTFKCYGNLP